MWLLSLSAAKINKSSATEKKNRKHCKFAITCMGMSYLATDITNTGMQWGSHKSPLLDDHNSFVGGLSVADQERNVLRF